MDQLDSWTYRLDSCQTAAETSWAEHSQLRDPYTVSRSADETGTQSHCTQKTRHDILHGGDKTGQDTAQHGRTKHNIAQYTIPGHYSSRHDHSRAYRAHQPYHIPHRSLCRTARLTRSRRIVSTPRLLAKAVGGSTLSSMFVQCFNVKITMLSTCFGIILNHPQ